MLQFYRIKALREQARSKEAHRQESAKRVRERKQDESETPGRCNMVLATSFSALSPPSLTAS